VGIASGRGFSTALYDHQIATFHLRHDATKDLVDKGVEGRVSRKVVGYVDLEAFVGGDGRRDSLQYVLERREGEGA